jgi:hypothetical protein
MTEAKICHPAGVEVSRVDYDNVVRVEGQALVRTHLTASKPKLTFCWERKSKMSATALPLPLELSRPVPMAADLDTLLSARVAKYDPKTQMAWGKGGGHNTSSKCYNYGFIQVDDVLQDFTIDL